MSEVPLCSGAVQHVTNATKLGVLRGPISAKVIPIGVPRSKENAAPRTCSRTMPRALWWSYGVGVFLCTRYPCTAWDMAWDRWARLGAHQTASAPHEK